MAKDWKKLSDKLGSSVEGPSAADWAAMEQMIANTPGLQAKPFFTASVKIAIISFALVISSAALWWITNPSPETTNQNHDTQEEISSSIQITAPIPAAEENDAQSNPQVHPAENMAEQEIEPASTTNAKKNPRENSAATFSSSEREGTNQNTTAPLAVQSAVNVTSSASAVEQKQATARANDLAVNEKQAEKMALNSNNGRASEAELGIAKEFENDGVEEPSNSVVLSDPSPANTLDQASPSFSDSLSSNQKPLTANDSIHSESAAPSDEAFAKDDSLNAVPESIAASDDDFIDPATGFKLQAVNFALGGATNFANPTGFGFQAAADFQWNRNNWFFQGGFSFSQDYRHYEYNVLEDKTLIDSTWFLTTNSRQVANVRAIWVIDSINAGHYEYDTTFQTVIDTSIVLNIDSNDYQINYPKSEQIRFQYAELPLLYGYQSEFGSWTLSLAAGVSVQQALAINDENYARAEAFSLALLVQPAISYKINQQWSVFTRIRLQEQLLDNRLFQTNQSPYSCQLGVSYHW
tara:strand:+ start:123632 stop:125203 length:1572 start_codon:yes stop_codon:yes gene_type:complete